MIKNMNRKYVCGKSWYRFNGCAYIEKDSGKMIK